MTFITSNIAKDIRLELRSGQSIFPLLCLSLLLVFIFGVSLRGSVSADFTLNELYFSLVWGIYLILGWQAVSMVLVNDVRARIFENLSLYNSSFSSYYIGKCFYVSFIILLSHFFTSAFLAIFLNYNIYENFLWYALLSVVVTLGYAALGVLIAGIVSSYRAGHIIYPLLFFPLALPLFLMTIEMSTHSSLTADPFSSSTLLSGIVGLTTFYLIVGILSFETVTKS